MNIVLIGYRCCGKSSTGKRIAEKLGRGFIDTDLLIVKRAGCNIDEMVSMHGWKYFREIEKAVIKEVSSGDNLVIATGGGAVTDAVNIENLRANGFIVWLNADADIIKNRMNGDASSAENRPSLTGRDPSDEIKKVLEQREELYRNASDLEIDTGKININDTADMIIDKAEKLVKKREQKREIRK